ncbi:unnamed protein product [Blepharisma stoltei]|uniref:TmcB/TmcC TPR repeats domain-containing protein n=1 Tax=Blepharisma stoltei TaxID=1481888 RepID=A0AAU9IMH8_9CILI|nr:unnamed protein product [Blepharisma stoltei]
MKLHEDTNIENLNVLSMPDQENLKITREIKTNAFDIFCLVLEQSQKKSTKLRKYISFLITWLQTIQVITLLYYPKMNIKEWSSYALFWQWLSYTRLDPIIMQLNVYLYSLIFAAVISILPIVYFIFLMIAKRRNEEREFSFIDLLIITPVLLITRYFYIPVLCLVVVGFKYLPKGIDTYMEEYDEERDMTHLYLSSLLITLSITVTLLAVAKELFLIDIRHYKGSGAYSKSSGRINVVRILAQNFQVLGYYFIFSDYLQIYYVLTIVMWCFISYLFSYRMPYYEINSNLTHSALAFIIAFSALAFLISLSTSSSVSISLIIFVSPMIFSLQYKLTHWLYKRYEKIPEELSKISPWKCELYMRKDLLANSLDVLKTFEVFMRQPTIYKSKIIHIFLSYYCYGVSKDSIKARLILYLAKDLHSSFDESLQEKLCKSLIERETSADNDTYRYLNFIKSFLKTTEMDKTTCFLLQKVWKELLRPKPPLRVIQPLIKTLNKNLKILRDQYHQLIKANNKNIESNLQLGSLMNNLLNLSEKGEYYTSIGMDLWKDQNRNRGLGLNPYNPSTCVILANCYNKISIRIEYANRRAINALSCNYSALIGSKFTDLFPACYENFHKAYLKKFVSGADIKLQLPPIFFIKNLAGHLIPIHGVLTIDSLNGSRFLIFVFQYNDEFLTSALVKMNATVQGCTESFPQLLNIDKTVVEKNDFSKHIPVLKALVKSYHTPMYCRNNIFIISIKTQIFDVDYAVFIALDGKGEVHKWEAEHTDKDNWDFDKRNDSRISMSTIEESHIGKSINSEHQQSLESKLKGYSSNYLDDNSEETSKQEDENPKTGNNKSIASTIMSSSKSALINQHFALKTSVKSNARNLKITLILATFIFIMINLGFAIFYEITVSIATTASELENYLVNRTYYILSASQFARFIDLKSRGLIFWDMNTIQAFLILFADDITTDYEKTQNNFDTFMSSCYKDQYIKNYAPMIEKISPGEPREVKENMFNALLLMRAYMLSVAARMMTEKLFLDSDDDLYNTFWLGSSKLINYLHHVQDLYHKNIDIQLEQLSIAFTIFVLVLSVMIACALLIMTWKLLILQKAYAKIWTIILTNPKDAIIEKYTSVNDRLESIHFIDTVNARIEPSDVTEHYQKDFHIIRIWKRLITTYSIFGLATIFYVCMLYFFPVKLCSDLYEFRHEFLMGCVRSRETLLHLWSSAKEIPLSGTNYSLHNILADHFYEGYFVQEFNDYLEDALDNDYYIQSLFTDSKINPSQSTINILFDSVNKSAITTHGLQEALIYFHTELTESASSEWNDDVTREFQSSLGDLYDILQAFEKLIDSGLKDLINSIDRQKAFALAMMYSLCVAALFILFFLGIPSIKSMEASILETWKFSHTFSLETTRLMFIKNGKTIT